MAQFLQKSLRLYNLAIAFITNVMKNHLYYCLALLFVAASAFAQHKKLKFQRVTNPCDNEVITSKYKKNGLLEEETSTVKGFNGVTITNKTLYKYNDKNQVISLLHICNDTLVSDEQSEYIGNDLVHFRRTVKGKLMLDEAYTYKKGKVQTVISTTPGGTLVKTTKYDADKRLTETTTKSGATVTAIEKEYRNGNTVVVEHYTDVGQKYPEVVKEYIYDFDGNLIDEHSFVNNLETTRTIYRFENNRRTSKKEFLKGVQLTEVLYDRQGNLLREENLDTAEVKMYDSKFNKNRDLEKVVVLKGDATELCTKTYDNEYWD